MGISGAPDNPATRGALCPLAYGAHQLNWHPARLKAVRHRGNTSSWFEASTAFAKASTEGPVVIIDGFPGRSTSQLFQDFASKRAAQYRVVLSPEIRSLRAYEAWAGVPATALGYDLENVRTIVSFGARMLDGWGSPGRFSHLWAEQASGKTDPQLRLIQIEPQLSRTASRAWKWISIRPETDSALAAGIARVLLEQRLVRATGPMPRLSLTEASSLTGLGPDAIHDLAQVLVAEKPTLAIADGDNPAVAALNFVLGSIGTPGGIIQTTKSAMPYLPAESNIDAARAVLIDSSVPWDFDVQTEAEVFRFAAWDGGSSKADWLLPAPGFLEELTDIPSAPGSSVQTYSLTAALTRPAFEVHTAAQFLQNVEPQIGKPEEIIHQRCAQIFKARTGSIYAADVAAVSNCSSPQKLEEAMWAGAIWMNEPLYNSRLLRSLREWPTEAGSATPQNSENTWSPGILPPLSSKLYCESNLCESSERRNA